MLPDALSRMGFAFYEFLVLLMAMLVGVVVGAGLLVWTGITFQRLIVVVVGVVIVGGVVVFGLLFGVSGFVVCSGMIGMLIEF